MPLTKRQNEILTFLRDYLAERDYAPSMEEIANHFGISSLNAIYKHLQVLEERGFIRRRSNQARSIQVLEEPLSGNAELPLLGRIAAGAPIEAVSNPSSVEVPEALLPRGKGYVLEVEGDSMIEDQIRSGDMVIVEERQAANNGETVVALIEGEEATLKRFYREGATIRLQPANAAMQPIYVDEDNLKIQGVVVGLLRRY